ncbi:hypothetical protein OROHE_016695 [Orobanche hederae]
MVMEVVHEDMGESNTQCTNHPYKNIAAPGGICAFCLQEKLRKLVSSSFTTAVFPSSSSSPSPSFRSDFDSGSVAAASRHLASSSRLPFVLTHRKKKKHHGSGVPAGGSSENTGKSIIFKRSKSTVTPRRGRGTHFLLDEKSFQSPYRRVFFWSFFYTSKHRKCERSERSSKDLSFTPAAPGTGSAGSSSVGGGVAAPARSRDMRREDFDEDGSPDDVDGLVRKVSRSRSVGCGSRSFSGDFFERISTGFGDCTLRRVESQREGKSKVQPSSVQRNGQDCIKERVKCGGIFSGFIITSSSSSSSSLVSEDNNNNNNNNNNNKSILVGNSSSHGRSRSWGWALASPMRAFSKPNSAGKRDAAAKHATPDLAAIPSLLAVIS